MNATVNTLRSARRRRSTRAALIADVLALVLVIGFTLEVLCGGTAHIPMSDVPPALIGNGDGLADFVIFQTREPRALTAVFAGALFALSGVLYQRLFSNVLATPDIIGVSAGASTGAVAVIVIGTTGIGQQLGAIVGAAAAAGLIFALGWRSGAASYRLILVDIGIGACFSALTSYLILFTNDATSTRIMQ